MNKENFNKRENSPVSCGKPIVLIVMTYVFIIIVNNNYFISMLDTNATRIKSKANGNCKSSIKTVITKETMLFLYSVVSLFIIMQIMKHFIIIIKE